MITVPDAIWTQFKQVVPEGKRSETITKLIRKYISEKSLSRQENFWTKLKNDKTREVSNEDPVKLAKEAWNYVD